MNAPELNRVAAAAQTSTASELERLLLLQKSFTPMDLLEDNNFDKMWRMAEALAGSALSVPKELKGNIGDCLAIVTQAMIWGLNPFACAQKAHVINGKLGYEAQLVNAVVMQSGAIVGSFHYEYQGDACRVGAVLRGGSVITWGEWLSAATVTTKNSPLWKTNPKQQMGYLQVKNWARAYCPGALLGIYSTDELEAMPDAMTPAQVVDALVKTPPAPICWPDEAFSMQLPRWTKAVLAGVKTTDDIVTLARTKGALSAEQEAAIRAIKAPEPEPEVDPFVADMEAAEGVEQ